jgi:hypothetical protein
MLGALPAFHHPLQNVQQLFRFPARTYETNSREFSRRALEGRKKAPGGMHPFIRKSEDFLKEPKP